MTDDTLPNEVGQSGGYTIFVVGRYHGDHFTPEQPFLDEARAHREAGQWDDLVVEEVSAGE